MHTNKKVYDVVFSMGEACSCAQALVRANLRQFSSPFDWLWGGTFVSRCEILASEFERFLEKKDLEYSYSERSILCDAYHNKHTKLTFNHDFASGKKLDETFPVVKEKYNRRIDRLLENIKKANSVLIVYIETPDSPLCPPDEEIKAGWNIIHQKYPDKKIDLLYFKKDNTFRPKQFKKEVLSNNITKIVANYKKQKKDAVPYAVEDSFLVKLLSPYCLNIPFSKRCKMKLMRFLIGCILIKPLKKKLKRKYHV